MNERLDIHVASDHERRAAHANVHDVWGRGLPLDQHVIRRMNAPLHRRATWYVGTLAGQVVSGLGCHGVVVRLRLTEMPAIAIASVHTLAAFRGRGFAPRLIAHVEAEQKAHGARLALLFSDVAPAYYERLGYVRCPAHYGNSLASTAAEPAPGTRLWRFEPALAIGRLAKLFESHHRGNPLLIARPEEYWRHLIARAPDDEFYWFIAGERICGYARMALDGSAVKLRDYAVEGGDNGLAENLFRALCAMARERRLEGVVGWLPDDPAARRCFEIRPRDKEITMFKPLDPTIVLDDDCLAAADRICEIDHV